jgi:predicted permease
VETLLKDLRYGYRTLLRNPGFTFIAVLSLALGIGANSAIFSFINTVLLKPLPARNPKELVLFGDGSRRGDSNGPSSGPVYLFSWREFHDFRKTNAVFQDMLAEDSTSNRVYASFTGDREPALATFVSGNYFGVLGVGAQTGHLFDMSVDSSPSPQAVLSDAFWTRRFHRDPAVVGSAFRVGDREYTILGVAARGFSGIRIGESPDLWLPVTMLPDFNTADSIRLQDPKSHFLNLMGRLKPGVSLAQAQANIGVILGQLLPTYMGNPPDPTEAASIRTAVVALTPGAQGLAGFRRRYQTPLVALMVVVALVLMIACANVANLLVALSAKRQREVAVRLAIGAGRSRLIRQMLTEGLLLSGVAALGGILIAMGVGRVLVHLISTGPGTLPIAFEVDGNVLAFTIAISFATGVLFSLAPAVYSSRVDLNTSLKEGKAGMATPRKVTFGRAMVVTQVALSLALLASAGMLLRSFENLVHTDTGFDREHVVLFKVASESCGYKQDARLAALYERIANELATIPGVSASSVFYESFHEGRWSEDFKVPGRELSEKDSLVALNFVTPGYFDTLRIPLLAGRRFDARDNAAAPLMAVINETFARKIFGGLDAVGKSFSMAPFSEGEKLYRVVGVVRDVKAHDIRDTAENDAWLPLSQGPVYSDTVAARVSGDAAAVVPRVRQAIHAIEPNLPIRFVTTLADEVSDSLVREHALAELCGFFAALALLLSAIGLYGTVSFTVARRTSEIGIRMALGADRSGVLGMVLRDAMTLVGVGIVAGLGLTLAAGKAMHSIVYGLGTFDFPSAACAVGVLIVVAAMAGCVPARRASRVDPMVALRYE